MTKINPATSSRTARTPNVRSRFEVRTRPEFQPLADDIEQLVIKQKLKMATSRKMPLAKRKQPLGTSQIECGSRPVIATVGDAAGAVGNNLLRREHESLRTYEMHMAQMRFVVNVVRAEILDRTQRPRAA